MKTPAEIEFLVPNDFLAIGKHYYRSLPTYVVNTTLQDYQSPPQLFIHQQTAFSELHNIKYDIKNLERVAVLFTVPGSLDSRLDDAHPISHAVSVFIETSPERRIIIHDPLYEEASAQPIKKVAFNAEARQLLSSVFPDYAIEEETTPQQKRGENPCVAMAALNTMQYAGQSIGEKVYLPKREAVLTAPWQDIIEVVKEGRKQAALNRETQAQKRLLSSRIMKSLQEHFTLDDDLEAYLKLSNTAAALAQDLIGDRAIAMFIQNKLPTATGQKLIEQAANQLKPYLRLSAPVSDWQTQCKPAVKLDEALFLQNRAALLDNLAFLN